MFCLLYTSLWLFGASKDTIVYANDYMTIYLFGTIFVLISLGMNSFINSQGFAKIGMCTVLIGAILNIVLDPIFIFTFELGVKDVYKRQGLPETVNVALVGPSLDIYTAKISKNYKIIADLDVYKRQILYNMLSSIK